jgi:hypothetical protein
MWRVESLGDDSMHIAEQVCTVLDEAIYVMPGCLCHDGDGDLGLEDGREIVSLAQHPKEHPAPNRRLGGRSWRWASEPRVCCRTGPAARNDGPC